MKSPLMYQMSEISCGEITIFNCVSFLFEREEMPLEFLKIMSSYALSCYTKIGELENGEFCNNLMFFTARWINGYAQARRIPLIAKYLKSNDVNLLEIRKCLINGGCVSLKTDFNGRHYIAIMKMDSEYVYAFDSYYKKEFDKQNPGVDVVLDKPFEYNRKIKIEKFISEVSGEYSLGAVREREAVLFFRDDAMLQREFG